MYIKMKSFLFLIADQCQPLGRNMSSGVPPYKGFFVQGSELEGWQILGQINLFQT